MALSNEARKVTTALDGQISASVDDLRSKAGLGHAEFETALNELIGEGLLKHVAPSNLGAPVGTVYLELTTLGFMSIP